MNPAKRLLDSLTLSPNSRAPASKSPKISDMPPSPSASNNNNSAVILAAIDGLREEFKAGFDELKSIVNATKQKVDEHDNKIMNIANRLVVLENQSAAKLSAEARPSPIYCNPELQIDLAVRQQTSMQAELLLRQEKQFNLVLQNLPELVTPSNISFDKRSDPAANRELQDIRNFVEKMGGNPDDVAETFRMPPRHNPNSRGTRPMKIIVKTRITRDLLLPTGRFLADRTNPGPKPYFRRDMTTIQRDLMRRSYAELDKLKVKYPEKNLHLKVNDDITFSVYSSVQKNNRWTKNFVCDALDSVTIAKLLEIPDSSDSQPGAGSG